MLLSCRVALAHGFIDQLPTEHWRFLYNSNTGQFVDIGRPSSPCTVQFCF